MPSTVNQQRLIDCLGKLPDCLVAFSGGVDGAVVAKAARLALGDRAIAVTGVSASLATGELEIARRIANAIGIRHEIIHTDELADPDYLKNALALLSLQDRTLWPHARAGRGAWFYATRKRDECGRSR